MTVAPAASNVNRLYYGQVAEWLKAPVSKTGIPVTPVSWVQIPPCPLPRARERPP